MVSPYGSKNRDKIDASEVIQALEGQLQSDQGFLRVVDAYLDQVPTNRISSRAARDLAIKKATSEITNPTEQATAIAAIETYFKMIENYPNLKQGEPGFGTDVSQDIIYRELKDGTREALLPNTNLQQRLNEAYATELPSDKFIGQALFELRNNKFNELGVNDKPFFPDMPELTGADVAAVRNRVHDYLLYKKKYEKLDGKPIIGANTFIMRLAGGGIGALLGGSAATRIFSVIGAQELSSFLKDPKVSIDLYAKQAKIPKELVGAQRDKEVLDIFLKVFAENRSKELMSRWTTSPETALEAAQVYIKVKSQGKNVQQALDAETTYLISHGAKPKKSTKAKKPEDDLPF